MKVEIFGLQEKKKNCWTFFAAAAQVYGGRIHESVESVEMISSYEIRAASIRKKGFEAVLDLQSQGVCDYMHWSLGSLHVLQGVLGLNLHGISVAGGVLIYVGISARQREGCCRRVERDRPMQICLCVIMRVYIFCWDGSARTRSLLVQGRARLNRWRAYEGKNKWVYKVSRLQRIESKGFWFEEMVIQVLQELQVASEKADGVRLWQTTTASEIEEETFIEDDLKARGGFRLLKGVRAERKGYSMTRGSWICSECQGQECQDYLTSTSEVDTEDQEKSVSMKMKNGEMKQSKKLLEDIAGIAGNCLTVCPSQEGGILRQCPQESPLANGQILIRLMGIEIMISRLSKGMISGILDRISQATREESQGVSWIRWVNQGCVESLSSSDDWMAGPVQSSSGCCTILKEFDSRLSAHGWNRKAKEKINMQKDVQVSVQALEQLSSQLKTIDEGDGYSDWQWDCHIPFIRRDVYVH
ncbi:hypothetical protein YC2023_040309 [Brassica napus]